MKKTDLKEIKGLEIKELAVKIKQSKNELSDLIVDKNSKKLKDIKSVGKIRKDIAQMMTILRQKQILGQLESESHKESKESKV